MRYMLEHKGIKFPTTNELFEARKKLRPAVTSTLNDQGVAVDYKELVHMTVRSVLNIVAMENKFE